jgi:hypothetical protein
MNDTLLDWLNMYGDLELVDKPMEINEYLQDKDQSFREAVEYNLSLRFGNYYCKVAERYNLYSIDKSIQTYILMQNLVPIICQPVFHNDDNKTLCQPDLIVRSDFLSSIFKEKLEGIDVYPIHYVVVDLKYLSLSLNKDGTIYNNGNIAYYKAKGYLETLALNQLQKVQAKSAFLLGRKYKINRGKNKEQSYYNNCFATLGIISMNDGDILTKVTNALSWLKDLKQNGKSWSISPPNNKNVYPNMSNMNDYPWHNLKTELAIKNKEITLIGGMGIKERNIFLDNNIMGWDKIDINNTELLSNKLGIKDKKLSQLQKMLDINNSNSSSS